MNISERIQKARKTAGFTQEKLGGLIGLSDKAISAYEQSRSVPPLSKLKLLAIATDHPLSYFTEEEMGIAEIVQKIDRIEKLFEEVKKLLKGNK